MRNKGIAVRTILLLVVGVLVAGILVYMVYSYFGGSALSESDCKARLISWCTTCNMSSYNAPIKAKEAGTCSNTYYGTGWGEDTQCNTAGVDVPGKCNAFLPGGGL